MENPNYQRSLPGRNDVVLEVTEKHVACTGIVKHPAKESKENHVRKN